MEVTYGGKNNVAKRCRKSDWRWEDNRHLGRPLGAIGDAHTLTKPNLLKFIAEHVCDLLVEDGSRWDEDKLGALFDEEICQGILSIPIDVDLGGDRWIWDFDRSGQYTVKMGGILPTVELLEERGMDINELCIMCNNAHEDVFHALIDYPELQLMWGGWKDEQAAFVAVVVYHAWERRNKKKFANEIIKVKWEKLEYPFMKLNVDVARSKSGGGAMGGLLRNLTGPGISKDEEMHACSGLVVECDSRMVVDMLHTPCDQASSLNAISDFISRKAKADSLNVVWIHSIPFFLSEVFRLINKASQVTLIPWGTKATTTCGMPTLMEGEDAQSSDENNEEAAEEGDAEEGDKEEEVHNAEGGHNVYGSEDSDSESVEDSAASITFGDSEEEDISRGFDIPVEQHNVFETETESENSAVNLNASTSKAQGLSDEDFKQIKDMTDYKFDLGTIFGSKTEFIDAVKTHAVHNGKSTKFIKNEKQRVRVICVGGTKVKQCLWTITTMKLPGEETSELRVCHNIHTCSRVTAVKLMSAD
ncbi:putative inactive protein kinase [Senna tora]|uniref:Putative inactive protein kinase n=1 Tax=Senna tora TaxID=362788 RepID=A0A834SGI8_9FABA|nr:putative inactive protein kinase [Senna tora]